MPLTVAVVLGAGGGVRSGRPLNKVYEHVAGVPMLVRAVRPFCESPLIDETYVVAAETELETCSDLLDEHACPVDVVLHGGATRHDSEARAVEFLAPRISSGDVGLVAIHDGARPAWDTSTIPQLLEVAHAHAGAIYALPLEDDLAEAHDDLVIAIRGPAGLWRALTPQVFKADVLLRAFRAAERDGFTGTDTASSVERLGAELHVVPGDPRNIKVTYPEDFDLAESIITGSGV